MTAKKSANNLEKATAALVEREISEAEVTVAGLTKTPPTITLLFEGQDDRSVRRSFVQQVPMRDAGLADRALSELHPGDRIQVAVVNEWRETGCDTYLAGFSRKAIQEGTAAKNGANGSAHSEKQSVVQVTQARKAATQK